MTASTASHPDGRMSRVDASDVTVIVSAAVDSEDRADNLRLLLDYLQRVCRDVAVVVVEQAVAPVLAPLCDRPGVAHHAIRDSGVHWKTRNLNRGAVLAVRDLVLFADCDVAPTAQALEAGLARLRNGASFVQLFDGLMVNVDRRILGTRPDWSSILAVAPHYDRQHQPGHHPAELALFSPLYGGENYLATGGCTACRRVDHFVAGGWNENIVSYGFEDQEYFERLSKLGWHVERIAGHNAYHLDHVRGRDSHYNDYYRLNEAEYERVAGFSRAELESYVANGFRRPAFRHGMRYARIETDTESRLYALGEDRRDLQGRTASVLVDAATPPKEACGFEWVVQHLESAYRNYQVVLFEAGGRRYADLENKANVVYRQLLAAEAASHPAAVEAVRLTADADRNRRTIVDALTRAAAPGDAAPDVVPESGAVRSLPAPGSLRAAADRGWDPSPHAIYLCFDDHYADFARACINSLRHNFPSHPQLLVDYAGRDARTLDHIASLGAQILPPAAPCEFARRMSAGPVGRGIVFRRFRLWDAGFDRYDVVLHLDADTLVLGELSSLFAGDRFHIVPNREPTAFVRVFDPIFELDPVLNERLAEDGMSYPCALDDMANAGVFAIPRRLRSPAERQALAYLAERYGEFFAYADQSLISLWCRYRALPFHEDVRYNYQGPFLTDATIDTDLSTIRVFHFSSARKPGTSEFRQWPRLGPHAAMLEASFDYYLSLY